MRIATAQKLLLMFDVLLVAGGVKVGFDVFKDTKAVVKDGEDTRARLRAELDAIKPSEITPPKVPTYMELEKAGGLLSGDWQVIVKPPVGPVAPVEQAAPKVDLGAAIRVVGIQSPLMAYLVNKKGGADEPVTFYYVGQEVPFVQGAFVKRVEPDRVVFDYRDGEQVVVYEEAPGGPAASSGGDAKPAREARIIPIASGITAKPGTTVVNISRDAIHSAQQTGAEEEILRGVKVGKARHTDGKPSVQFDSIPPNSPLAKGGLVNGDYLVSINNERVTSQAEATAYVKANSNLPRYTVVIMRQGRRVVRSVEVK